MRRNELVKAGSSPLARGLQVSSEFELADWRIIPARAGFTLLRSQIGTFIPDHPRSRGVYPGTIVVFSHHFGIIPARAGFTRHMVHDTQISPDHPRSRGVY